MYLMFNDQVSVTQNIPAPISGAPSLPQFCVPTQPKYSSSAPCFLIFCIPTQPKYSSIPSIPQILHTYPIKGFKHTLIPSNSAYPLDQNPEYSSAPFFSLIQCANLTKIF